ncbi:hypothetical protein KUCAC02_022130 [Chaenocephalus aceratus]|nr:hypothetical protein KUCAC02_022130 [Chaenocephalus aceratus]
MSSNSSNASSSSEYTCFSCRPSFIIFTSYCVANILVLLPLYSYIFYLGIWRTAASSLHVHLHEFGFLYAMAGKLMCGRKTDSGSDQRLDAQ